MYMERMKVLIWKTIRINQSLCVAGIYKNKFENIHKQQITKKSEMDKQTNR